LRPLPHLPSSQEVHLWHIPHDQLLLPELPLSNSEVERAQSYRFEKDQRRYLVTQTRKREILGGYLDIQPAELVFTQTPTGRPEVEGLFFSISHTAGRSVLAVSTAGPLGIDLEKVTPRTDLDELAEYILTKEEKEHYLALPAQEHLTAFYKVWTAKEAYLKALSTGLQIEPRLVTTNFPQLTQVVTKQHPALRLTALPTEPDYQLHLATNTEIRLFEWQNTEHGHSCPC